MPVSVWRAMRLAVVAALAGLNCMAAPAAEPGRLPASWRAAAPRFVIYYGVQDLPVLARFDLAVLDPEVDAYTIDRYRRSGGLALAYISVGEVHASRPFAATLEAQGLLLHSNDRWPDARYVDLRDIRWQARVLDDIVPAILQRGFGGVFLDTLDDAAYLESREPRRYAGMTAAAIELVHALRERYPAIPIMVNRGYALLPRIARDIDMVLGESLHSTYDFSARAYVKVADSDVRWQREQLMSARRQQSDLLLFSLDYWSPADQDGISQLYAQSRASGFIPYIATIDLTQVLIRP